MSRTIVPTLLACAALAAGGGAGDEADTAAAAAASDSAAATPAPGAPPIFYGDSIGVHAGPYESVLRKGVQVTSESVVRLQNGKLVGTARGHYTGGGPDPVRRLRIDGTRKP
jgi:hypothetical protein